MKHCSNYETIRVISSRRLASVPVPVSSISNLLSLRFQQNIRLNMFIGKLSGSWHPFGNSADQAVWATMVMPPLETLLFLSLFTLINKKTGVKIASWDICMTLFTANPTLGDLRLLYTLASHHHKPQALENTRAICMKCSTPVISWRRDLNQDLSQPERRRLLMQVNILNNLVHTRSSLLFE